MHLPNRNHPDYDPNHFVDANGKVYARVSAIISPFFNRKGIDKDVLQRKAELGTRVHNAIDEYLEGALACLPPTDCGYFHSFEKWHDQLRPTFVKRKVRYYCDDIMVTGEIDALAHFENEKKAVLIDWKTSASPSHDSWRRQAHFYHYLLEKNGIEVEPRFLFVMFNKYGDLPLVFQYNFDKTLQTSCIQAARDFWAKLE